MSYDLHVLSPRRPRPADLEAFLDSSPEAVEAGGRLRAGGSTLLGGGGVHVEVDGPVRIAPEDVPGAASGAIRRAGWLTALSVKPSGGASWPGELATHLARAAEGVVYDPQRDAVTWPSGWRARAGSEAKEVIDLVELCWYVTRAAPREEAPETLLELLRARSPAALPRRYGDVEPFQHRFVGDGADVEFAAFWRAQSVDPLGMFFWTARRPCFGATVSTTPPARQGRGGELQRRTAVTLRFDSRPLFRDPAAADRIVGLFLDVARALDCPYAAGTLNRGFVAYRNGAWSGGGEVGPLPFGSAWVGLPAAPTWLAWFGRPYAGLVAEAVAGHVAAERPNGLLLRLGDEPAAADALADAFPPLPARLVARAGKGPGRWLAGVRFDMGHPPPSGPAEEIPDVG